MPASSTAFKYFAFISYSRKDSKAAAWLQKRLEWFRFPVKLVPEDRRPPHDRYVRPIYRDKTNLEVTDEHYWTNIRRALEESRYLVVLCSPHSAKSEPVNMEVAHFLETHGGDTSLVAPVIVSGNVTSTAEDAALCPALRDLGDPLINRNLPTMVPDAVTAEQDAWEQGFISLVSYLLRLERTALGDHIQRESKRQARVFRRVALTMMLLAAGAVFAGVLAWKKRNEALEREAELRFKAGVEALSRHESASALQHFAEALEIRPDDSASLALATELLARTYWPVAEGSLDLDAERVGSDEGRFSDYLNESRQIPSTTLLLLSSSSGERMIVDYETKKVVTLSDEKTALPDAFKNMREGSYGTDGRHTVAFAVRDDQSLVLRDAAGNISISEPQEWEESVLGYDEEAHQLISAVVVSEDEGRSVLLTRFSAAGGKLTAEKSSRIQLEAEQPVNDARVLGFVERGSSMLVGSPAGLWRVDEETATHADFPLVERIASSPDGKYAALLRQAPAQHHGTNNFLVSIATFDDHGTYHPTRPLTLFSEEDRLRVVSRSEEIPVRNRLFGHTGAWYRQGYSGIHFIGPDRFIVVTGSECHWFRVWDRRAWDEPLASGVDELDDSAEETVLPDEVDLVNHVALLTDTGVPRPLLQEYPVHDLRWLIPGRQLLTAARYKYYGAQIHVWDRDSAFPVIGPLPGMQLAPDSNASSLHICGAINAFSEYGTPNYWRECYVPAKASPWLLRLASAVAFQRPLPTDAPLPSDKTERQLAERLLYIGPTAELPIRVNSTVTRARFVEQTMPAVRKWMKQ